MVPPRQTEICCSFWFTQIHGHCCHSSQRWWHWKNPAIPTAVACPNWNACIKTRESLLTCERVIDALFPVIIFWLQLNAAPHNGPIWRKHSRHLCEFSQNQIFLLKSTRNILREFQNLLESFKWSTFQVTSTLHAYCLAIWIFMIVNNCTEREKAAGGLISILRIWHTFYSFLAHVHVFFMFSLVSQDFRVSWEFRESFVRIRI